METYHLQVHVKSGIIGASLEGFQVKLFGPQTMVSTIDKHGIASFDFEAPEGESYLVKFMDNEQNFNPQGIAATSWSPVLTSEKLEAQITVGEDNQVELIAIPCTDISLFFENSIVQEGDSLHLIINHELFSSEVNMSGSGGIRILSYSGPIGNYEYHGFSFKTGDTIKVVGSYAVSHEESFSYTFEY